MVRNGIWFLFNQSWELFSTGCYEAIKPKFNFENNILAPELSFLSYGEYGIGTEKKEDFSSTFQAFLTTEIII